MKSRSLALSCALAVVVTVCDAGTRRTVTLPLRRGLSHHQTANDNELGPAAAPPKVWGFESLIWTVDVRVGGQLFNLTLDTTQETAVIFSKGFTPADSTCNTGTAVTRNLFDQSLSGTFEDSNEAVKNGWGLYRYPYVGSECHRTIWVDNLNGTWAWDTFDHRGLFKN